MSKSEKIYTFLYPFYSEFDADSIGNMKNLQSLIRNRRMLAFSRLQYNLFNTNWFGEEFRNEPKKFNHAKKCSRAKKITDMVP